MRAALAAVAAVVMTVVLAGPVAGPATAQGFEHIGSYDIDIQILGSGTIEVREVIDYDFASLERHGIYRDIPVRLRYDDRYDRIYELEVVSVDGSPGTPVQFIVEDAGNKKRIRIGDPDRTISGQHTYTITYLIKGSLNRFSEHDELYWNAIGTDWSVPIDRAAVTVRAPAPILQVACFSGPQGSNLACAGASTDGTTARFSQDRLAPFEALTVVVGFPLGSIQPAPTPILDERWSMARAFSVNPTTVGATAGLLAAVIAGFTVLAWRTGRDRRWLGSDVDAAFGGPPGDGETATDEPVPLGGFAETPVEFEPPDRLRPGLIGTLVDETAHPLDATATIVDLAVRGYLRIEEIPKEGWFGKPDWRLVRLDRPEDDLRRYEELLLHGLFSGTNGVVQLSELKQKFSARLQKVQDALYQEVVDHGWFLRRPDSVRQMWVLTGVAVLLGGIALVVAAAAFTHIALIPIPIALAGLLVIVGSRSMPRRTPKGTAVLRRAHGFRRFIEESEKDRAQFAERQNLFSEYLPYAVVFGATEKWARAFAGLDDALPQTAWYVSSRPFTVGVFSDSMDGFAVTTSGTISSTPASSGSSGFGGGGFSGGGGGGGGGGSW